MAAPALNAIAQRVYDEVSPIAYADADNGYALAYFIEAWTAAMVFLEDFVRDTDAGPGYSSVVNPDTAPGLFLDWLAQFVGVKLVMGESDDSKRTKIKSLSGLRRGGPDAIRSVAARTLTGTKTVIFDERAGGNAWALAVGTLSSETPSAAVVISDVLTQKPAGITFNHFLVAGWSYLGVRAGYTSYTTLRSSFVTYNGIRNNAPGT